MNLSTMHQRGIGTRAIGHCFDDDQREIDAKENWRRRALVRAYNPEIKELRERLLEIEADHAKTLERLDLLGDSEFALFSRHVLDHHGKHPNLDKSYRFVKIDGAMRLVDCPTGKRVMAQYVRERGTRLAYTKDSALIARTNGEQTHRWKPAKVGVGESCFTLFPPHSRALYKEAMDTTKLPRVKKILGRWYSRVIAGFEKETGREVLGGAIHLDTWNAHGHLFHTRVGKNQIFLPNTQKGLRLIGPDAVGKLRQAAMGFLSTDSTTFKEANYWREKCLKAYGEEPLDWIAARDTDRMLTEELGDTPELREAMLEYGREVPKAAISSVKGAAEGAIKECMILQGHGDILAHSLATKGVMGTISAIRGTIPTSGVDIVGKVFQFFLPGEPSKINLDAAFTYAGLEPRKDSPDYQFAPHWKVRDDRPENTHNPGEAPADPTPEHKFNPSDVPQGESPWDAPRNTTPPRLPSAPSIPGIKMS
jgi:hypothetical protein